MSIFFAGDEPLLNYFHWKTKIHGLSDYVIFPGRTRIHEIPILLQASKIVEVCSLAETLGLAIVEPLMKAVPVITT